MLKKWGVEEREGNERMVLLEERHYIADLNQAGETKKLRNFLKWQTKDFSCVLLATKNVGSVSYITYFGYIQQKKKT